MQVIFKTVSAEEFWQFSNELPILDVRSPGEFEHGHIPRAINVPLFTDQERAEIGTSYKKEGRQSAVRIGLTHVSKILVDLVDVAIKHSIDGRILIHCWRGGMRSQSYGHILELAGLNPILLNGGYKSYRKMVRESFDRDVSLAVISGLTGVGKTDVLNVLKANGEQVIDLEGLANHRGSAFGGIGQPNQPTTEQFENRLFSKIDHLDLDRTTWIEDEGNRIGRVNVPAGIYQRLRTAPAIEIQRSLNTRIRNLLVDYGDLASDELIESIAKIKRRLGGLAAQQAISAVEDGDLSTSIKIVLAYYDKTYNSAIKTMPRLETIPLPIDGMSDEQLVSQLKRFSDQFKSNISCTPESV